MKEDTRQRLVKLILEELSDKIKNHESLGHKLEPFTDLPVEKVADAILKQFEYLLSSDLRDLIIHLIEQEVAAEKQEEELQSAFEKPKDHEEVVQEDQLDSGKEITGEIVRAESDESVPAESIMEHFGTKESFPSSPMDIPLKADDWFYVFGFGYAPDSAGKGIPTVQLDMKGIDKTNNIFLLDYGDVRLYMNKLNSDDFTRGKTGEPTLNSKAAAPYKFVHEQVLNSLRTQEVLVPMPFWTLVQGRENIIKLVEDRYVELLRALIDVHDAVDWDVEVFVSDEQIANIPEIVVTVKGRPPQRESRHPVIKQTDVKMMEKVIMHEKKLAQEIHSKLLVKALKGKVDFMIRLDSAFFDEWKSILSVRYSVGKEKRKGFCQAVAQLQTEYKEYELMVRVSSPSVRFSFQ